MHRRHVYATKGCYNAYFLKMKEKVSLRCYRVFFTHVASIYANLLEE